MYSPFERDALGGFARRLKAARLRRNLTQAAVAERAGVSRDVVLAAEAAAPGTSIGAIVKILSVFGLADRLADALAIDTDGELAELDTGRKRARSRHVVANF
jgi:transcriptional regulator with XRE-family HTH domain